MHQLLDGIRIVDLTRALAGPTCTALLADFGAEVIKIENLPEGDGARRWGPFSEDRSQYFASVNRNKRSIALDLRDTQGKEVLEHLIRTADVLVENFRPGVLAAMGLDPHRLRRQYPRLVLASISGFGPVGPERSSAGLDQIAQGMSGLMSVTGAEEHTPMRVGVPIVDSVTGIVAAMAVGAALTARERSGEGTHVQTSLLESAMSLLSFQAQRYLALGEVPEPTGNDHPVIAPYGAFRTADSPINIAAGSERHWHALCEVLATPELAQRPDYIDSRARLANRASLQADIESRLEAEPATHWIPLIRGAGIPCGPIHRIDQVFADPQVHALGLAQRPTDSGREEGRLLRGPVWVEDTPAEVRSAPPDLGEHTTEILTELGLDNGRITDLVRTGVAFAAPTPKRGSA